MKAWTSDVAASDVSDCNDLSVFSFFLRLLVFFQVQ